MESKGQFNQRMHRTGKFQEFAALRQMYRDSGMSKEQAAREARAKYALPEGEMAVGPTHPESNGIGAMMKTEAPADGDSVSLDEFKPKVEWDTNPKRTIEWVFQYWQTDDVVPWDAPSPGAWSLRDSMRTNGAFRAQFYMNIYPKLLPTKTQLDELLARMADDGRDVIDLCEAFAAVIKSKEPEDAEETEGLQQTEPGG
jgi:hypothetical protein